MFLQVLVRYCQSFDLGLFSLKNFKKCILTFSFAVYVKGGVGVI